MKKTREEHIAERDHLLRCVGDILNAADEGDGRDLTEDEERAIEDKQAQADAIESKLASMSKVADLRANIAAKLDSPPVANQRKAPHLQPEVDGDKKPEIVFKRSGRLKHFPSEMAAYKSGQWLRAQFGGDEKAAQFCREQGMEIQRAQSEGINSAGGHLVPIEFEQTVIDLREYYGVFRQNAKVVAMASDTKSVARRTGGLTAYWVGEGVAGTESQKAWDSVGLTARKMMIIAYISSELNEDSIIGIAEDLARESAYAFALREDQTGFIGDGTPTYNGVVGMATAIEAQTGYAGYVNATSGTDTFEEVDAADLARVRSVLPQYAEAGAAWYCSKACKELVFGRLMVAAGGNTQAMVGGKMVDTYLGDPIITTQVLQSTSSTINNNAFLLYGDLRQAATMGDRRSFTFATSTDLKFLEDQIALKATQRIDINVHDIGDATDAGPMVALIGNT